MTGKVYFILGSTFFMGVFTGAYLYVSVFAPEYSSDTVDNLDISSFVIEGQMYGGCQEINACASFQLVDARTYSYLASPDVEIVKGKLPADLGRAIKKAFSVDMLESAGRSISSFPCAAYVDGVDYEYRVMYKEVEYELNTCSTFFAYEDTTQELLVEVWKYMDDPKSRSVKLFEKSISEILIERFNAPQN